jgi:hypothetical protein
MIPSTGVLAILVAPASAKLKAASTQARTRIDVNDLLIRVPNRKSVAAG